MLQTLAWVAAFGLVVNGGQTSGTAMDAAAVKVGAVSTVTELDLGKLKGELRQIGWSSEGAQLYIQTADGNPGSEKLRHYVVPSAGGVPKSVDAEPDWATTFWAFKSDRSAPGVGGLVIGFEQKQEKTKIGTGSGRPGEMGGGAGVSADKIAEGQQENVARLTLLGETISEFVNQMPIPGLMFSWGPNFSGAIAYTTRDTGQLILLDRNRHKQTVSGVKDAVLPAWSIDGSRLAWAQKTGRKKYALMWAPVTRG